MQSYIKKDEYNFLLIYKKTCPNGASSLGSAIAQVLAVGPSLAILRRLTATQRFGTGAIGMPIRKIFYSFHYKFDAWRVSQVRNMGIVEGNRPAHDNEWETVKVGGNAGIKRWIDNQMIGRSCTVVLVGADTANRPWINYEIEASWAKGMGVLGVHINGLNNMHSETTMPGKNPFNFVTVNGHRASDVIACHDPGWSFQPAYHKIKQNLNSWIEAAIAKRGCYR